MCLETSVHASPQCLGPVTANIIHKGVPDRKNPKLLVSEGVMSQYSGSTVELWGQCLGSTEEEHFLALKRSTSRGFSEEELRFSDANVFGRMQRMAPTDRSFFNIITHFLTFFDPEIITRGPFNKYSDNKNLQQFYTLYLQLGLNLSIWSPCTSSWIATAFSKVRDYFRDI